jgi:hypothetical protein
MKNSLLKCIAAGSILKVIYDKMHPVLSPSGWDDISNLMRSHSIMTVETFILGVLLFLTLLIQKTETLGFWGLITVNSIIAICLLTQAEISQWLFCITIVYAMMLLNAIFENIQNETQI